jgi:RNA polymerase sigma factor (sigma-70 family)
MSELSETEQYADFIRRVRAGDERAAAELVKKYESEIRLEIRVWLRMRDPRLKRVFDSMDICQSVLASFFVRAAVGDFDLDQPGQLIRLLVGMARNKLSEHVKHHQRQRRDVRRTAGPEAQELLSAANDETPSQMVAGKELLEKFRELLSAEERQLADLRGSGLDWSAVAVEMGGTADGRRKQFARAIERVGAEMGLDTAIK